MAQIVENLPGFLQRGETRQPGLGPGDRSVEPTLRPSVVLADEPTQPQVEPERVTGTGGRPKSASREGSMVTDRI